jgi:hypothetical protein
MTINKTIIRELENIYKKSIPDDLKKYLLVKYEQEPFPDEFSEQDLYANIERDIRDYEADELDVTVKSASERWLEEREYLQNLYIEKSRVAHDLEDYIAELEHILSEHSLESSRMSDRRRIQF